MIVRDSGALLAFSSDGPIAEINPFYGIHSAVTSGDILGSQNGVSLNDAVKAHTLNAAHSSFEEDMKGSLKVGKLADIVVLSDNLFEIPVDEITKVESVLTIVGGKEAYRS